MPDPIGVNANGTAKTKTEAPTSGETLSASETAALNAVKLTEIQFDFVNLVHQHYSIHGVLFTADLGLELYGIGVASYNELINDETVLAALSERKIPLTVTRPESETWRHHSLTGEQIIVADTMLDLLDRRSYKKKLADLGVDSKRWAAWCKEPAFAKYLDDNTQAVLKNGQHEAALALMDKVSTGDLKAIQLYWEYTDRFVSRTGAANSVNPAADNLDAKRIIQQIIEIVIDEVDDHQIASRIADRMKNLMTSTQIANELTNPGQLQQPEVVPNRVLTPAMVKTGMQL